MARQSQYSRAPSVHSFGRWHWLDADWNSRFPFGISMCLYLGRQDDAPPCEPDCEPDCQWHQASAPRGRGFTLDLNGPLGDPNRLYLWGRRRNIILGLPSWHTEIGLSRIDGSDRSDTSDGKPAGHTTTVRSRPHLEAMPRYRYHEGPDGDLIRNDEPEPMHWGWLTIEQRPRNT